MQEIDRSKYNQNFKFLGQKFGCPSHYHGRAQKFFQGGKVYILLICFWLLTMQRRLTYTKKKMSNVAATVAYNAFLVRKLYTEQMFVIMSTDTLRLS